MDPRPHIRLVRALADGEDAFLRQLDRGAPLEAAAFEGFLRREKLLPWVAPVGSSERVRGWLPEALAESLREAGRTSGERVSGLVALCREATAALAEAGVDALVYKGLVHGACLYGDPRLRHQGDVDLMVRRGQVEVAVEALGSVGYDVRVDGSSGEPMPERVSRMLRKPLLRKGVDACTLRRGPREKVDLHWCLRMRYLPHVGVRRLSDGRRTVDVGGLAVETFSEEDTLLVLVLMIAEKLRRAVLQQKLFLDLLLAGRALGPAFDWEAFLCDRRGEGLERLTTNVLAIFLELWECGEELPGLAAAVGRRRALLEVADREEVDALVARDRKHRRNRVWYDRAHAPRAPGGLWFRLGPDLPHTLARRAGRRLSTLRFGAGEAAAPRP